MSTNGMDREVGRPVHAYDRTLLAKLGFSDRDKGEPRHDLACEYLSTGDRLLDLFGIKPRLGKKFEAWVAARKKAPQRPAREV